MQVDAGIMPDTTTTPRTMLATVMDQPGLTVTVTAKAAPARPGESPFVTRSVTPVATAGVSGESAPDADMPPAGTEATDASALHEGAARSATAPAGTPGDEMSPRTAWASITDEPAPKAKAQSSDEPTPPAADDPSATAGSAPKRSVPPGFVTPGKVPMVAMPSRPGEHIFIPRTAADNAAHFAEAAKQPPPNTKWCYDDRSPGVRQSPS